MCQYNEFLEVIYRLHPNLFVLICQFNVAHIVVSNLPALMLMFFFLLKLLYYKKVDYRRLGGQMDNEKFTQYYVANSVTAITIVMKYFNSITDREVFW